MASRNADVILARFPGPVTLHVSRLKMLMLVAGSLVFVAGGIFLLIVARHDPEALLAGLASILFFGACAAVGAVMLLPGAGSLTLDAEGFEVCSLFRRHRTSWRQASGFTVVTVPGAGKRMIAYDDDRLSGFMAQTNQGLTGRNAAIPDDYRLSYDNLAWLLTQWREKALAQGRHAPVPRFGRTRPG